MECDHEQYLDSPYEEESYEDWIIDHPIIDILLIRQQDPKTIGEIADIMVKAKRVKELVDYIQFKQTQEAGT